MGKFKKFLALGLIGVVGAVSLTGCSLNSDQQDSLDKLVSKTEELTQIIEKQNNKLNKEDAYNVFTKCVYKIFTNANEICDNMKLTIKANGTEEIDDVYRFYKFNNTSSYDGQRVLIHDMEDGLSSIIIEGCYNEDEQSLTPGSPSGTVGSRYMTEIDEEGTVSTSNDSSVISEMTHLLTEFFSSFLGVNENEIVGYTKCEDESYSFEIINDVEAGENFGEKLYSMIKIDKNGNIKEMVAYSLVDFDNGNFGYQIGKELFEYGTITEAEVLSAIGDKIDFSKYHTEHVEPQE